MTLDLPPPGDRRDFHVSLHESDFHILNDLCERYDTSRAKVIAALLRLHRNDPGVGQQLDEPKDP